jgi:lipoyl(octanoyl) transferase
VTSDRKKPGLAVGVSTAANDEVFTTHQSPVTGHRAPCLAVDLGPIGYSEAYQLQQSLVAALKASNSVVSSFTGHQLPFTSHVLLLCEHPHVITLGRNGKREHLLASEHVLRQKGVEFQVSDRGGDITYHGPGQIVGYPILNLAAIRRDVGWYVRMLEETMIRATGDFGIAAHRESGRTGIWVAGRMGKKDSPQRAQRTPSEEEIRAEDHASPAEKLGAIGVHLSRWVTSHGFAYNVSTDLRYFDLIVPCGINDRKATSLEKILGQPVDRKEITAGLIKHFGEIFGLDMISTSREELCEGLQRVEQQPVAIPA